MGWIKSVATTMAREESDPGTAEFAQNYGVTGASKRGVHVNAADVLKPVNVIKAAAPNDCYFCFRLAQDTSKLEDGIPNP
jgi:hypothetical protein